MSSMRSGGSWLLQFGTLDRNLTCTYHNNVTSILTLFWASNMQIFHLRGLLVEHIILLEDY